MSHLIMEIDTPEAADASHNHSVSLHILPLHIFPLLKGISVVGFGLNLFSLVFQTWRRNGGKAENKHEQRSSRLYLYCVDVFNCSCCSLVLLVICVKICILDKSSETLSFSRPGANPLKSVFRK